MGLGAVGSIVLLIKFGFWIFHFDDRFRNVPDDSGFERHPGPAERGNGVGFRKGGGADFEGCLISLHSHPLQLNQKVSNLGLGQPRAEVVRPLGR